MRGSENARHLAKLASAWVAVASALLTACAAEPPRAAPPAAVESSKAPTPPAPARTLLAALRPTFPRPGASGVCLDARLALAAPGVVALGAAGAIRVVDVEKPDTPVDVIEPGTPGYIDSIGGRMFRLVSPVAVEEGFVHVRLRTGVLEPNRTYAVTVDEGVFVDAEGRSLGALADTSVWRFTTRAPAPASPGELVVAADGSGDFAVCRAPSTSCRANRRARSSFT